MASKEFNVDINLNGNLMQNLRVETVDIGSLTPIGNDNRIVYYNGQYYYSNGTSWLLFNTNVLNNYVIVKQLSDFPTPVGGVITLVNNVTYVINGSVNIGTNTITLGTNNCIFGYNRYTDILTYTGSSVLFTGVSKTFSVENITITANTTNATIFALSGSSFSVLVRDIMFINCYGIGSIAGGNQVQIFHNDFTNVTVGISLGSAVNLLVFDNVFNIGLATITWLTIPASQTFDNIAICRNYLDILVTQTGMNIPITTTVVVGNFQNNEFDNTGTALVGITYASANWTFNSNIGIANNMGADLITAYNISPISGTVPTTVACGSASLSSLTGIIALTYANGANSNASLGFNVPADYFGNPRFEIEFTNDATTAGNINLQMIINKATVGSSFLTQTYTSAGNTLNTGAVATATSPQRKKATITPTGVSLVAGDYLGCRLYRQAGTSPDTFGGVLFVIGVRFLYDKK